jgi:flagellar biosynthetic protein FliP
MMRYPALAVAILPLAVAMLLFAPLANAQPQADTIALVAEAMEGDSYSLSIQILIMMTLLTILPAAVLSTSAFVRIIIVLSILRQALGTAQTPPNQVLLGVALFLTFFVMSPVISSVYEDSVKPYIDGEITAAEAFDTGKLPLRNFMMNQTREADIQLFSGIAGSVVSAEEAPMSIVIPSFMVSELKTAFYIGFLVFLPFLIIDLVVSSVLMSMGMMMLSPMLISLPFKIMLFVLVDGWSLILGSLAASFYV